VPTFNYFQTAACLYEEGQLDASGVERVGRALVAREAFSREMLENSLGDVLRRGHLGRAAWEELADELRRRDVLALRPPRLRDRWLAWWRRRRPAEKAAGPPETPTVPDYLAIVAARRAER
jgi:hypothetical protein